MYFLANIYTFLIINNNDSGTLYKEEEVDISVARRMHTRHW